MSTATTEQIRAYWDRQPCNLRHGARAAIGSFAWSRGVSLRKYSIEHHILSFAEFPKWRDKDVLEIGCGIGTDTLHFLRYGARVDALDISIESLKLAEQRATLDNLSDAARFIHCDAEAELPQCVFRSGYDLIYSFGVLHHTPHPERVLQAARTRIAPDGVLKLMLYYRYSWKHIMHHQPQAQAGCPLVKWYTRREATRLLEDCGFHVRWLHVTHIFPWRWQDYREHRYVLAFPWNMINHRRLERWLGHHLLIEAIPQ